MAFSQLSRRLLFVAIVCTGLFAVTETSTQSAVAQDNGADAEPTATPVPTQNPNPTPTPADEAANDTGEPAELPPSLLVDVNGDGVVRVLAFGDSITRGVGDFTPVGEDIESASRPAGEAGYPLRVERFINVPTANAGDPGEELLNDGLLRFPRELARVNPDVAVLVEGSNDAERFKNRDDIALGYQSLINITRAKGLKMIIGTLTPTCCNRGQFDGSVEQYNEEIRALAVANDDVSFVDINRAYLNVCRGSNNCPLLNLPEGLHPNTRGYDVSGEMVTAALLGIDLLDPTGPELFKQAIGNPNYSVITVPNPLPQPTPAQ